MSRIEGIVRLIFAKKESCSEAEIKQKRQRGVILTAGAAAVSKVFMTLIPLITVRITLDYLGIELYGLWNAATSFFAMFSFADLGLGSGLQTELSRAATFGDGEANRRIITSVYVMLAGVAFLMSVFWGLAYPYVDWPSVLNVQDGEGAQLAGCVLFVIVVPTIINIPASLIQRTQLALQEGYRYHLWQCAGSCLGLLLVLLVAKINLGPVVMIGAVSSVTVVTALLNSFVYYGFQQPGLRPSLRFFDSQISKGLLQTGLAFFVLSVLTALSLSLDNYLVGKAAGMDAVTPYALQYKIAGMISTVTLMLSTPMWTANGEALSRGDYDWVKKATRKVVWISLLFSASASVGCLLFAQPVLDIVPGGAVAVSYGTLLGMCLMQVLLSFTSPFFMVLNGAKIIRFQVVLYLVFAAVSLPLKIFLAEMLGPAAIAWTGAVFYLFFITVPTFLRARKVFL